MNDQNTIEMPEPEPKPQRAVAKREQRAVTASQPSTPADMVMYALQNGGSLEQVRELMQMRREWEADEARKAFNAAKVAFKAESITLTKDKENKQYKSMYVTLGNLVSTVTPFLSKHGLSADWTIDQVLVPGQVTVACVLSHSQGHSERVQFTVPPDTAGAKNPIQQIKSAITYAKAVTFESVCGMAATDANEDDDGNSAGLNKNAVRDAVADAAPTKHVIDQPTLKRAIASIKADQYSYDNLIDYYALTPEQLAYARAELGMPA